MNKNSAATSHQAETSQKFNGCFGSNREVAPAGVFVRSVSECGQLAKRELFRWNVRTTSVRLARPTADGGLILQAAPNTRPLQYYWQRPAAWL